MTRCLTVNLDFFDVIWVGSHDQDFSVEINGRRFCELFDARSRRVGV